MNTISFPPAKRRPAAFSLIEVILVVAALGIIAALLINNFSTTKISVSQAKLASDVKKLNTLLTVYQSYGGSLDGITSAQDVIDKLKTVRDNMDAKGVVGPMTGRAVDVRLTANMQSTTEAASNAPRAIWNPNTKQFDIATTGSGGVASFSLNNDLADANYGVEVRSATNEVYNKNDGWVWENSVTSGLPFLSPLTALLASTGSNVFNPTQPDGGLSLTMPTPLSPPSITPQGGSYFIATFPGTVTISAGSVPAGVSTLLYQVVHENGSATGWNSYTSPVAITYGDTVMAQNASTDAVNYQDSPVNSQFYDVQPTVLASPIITPTGGLYVASVWPSISIVPNCAQDGVYSSMSYQITSSNGTKSAWRTYRTGDTITTTYGDTVTAKNISTNPRFYSDSNTTSQTYNLTGSTQLPPPIFTDYYDSAGKRYVIITPDPSKMPIPAGVRIYYTLDGTDPGIKSTEDPVKGTLYDPTKMVPVSSSATYFLCTARCYPPTADKTHWDTSDMGDYDISISPGLAGGHVDVDTSHLLYPLNKGSTDAHVHAYDDKYNITYIDMMSFASSKLKNIQNTIGGGVYFKLIVSNGSLSPGLRLTINKTYNTNDATTYTPVNVYDDIPLASLPVYTTDGKTGSTKLTKLSFNFANDTVGGVINTVTGAVRGNKVGALGEARNGALTIQAVRCNADGSPAFTTSTAISNGGVHGFATSGLLWECTVFWHWHGGAYGTTGWTPVW